MQTQSTAPRLAVIRRASLAEADVVAAITDAAYAKYVSRLGRKPLPMTADHQRVIAEHAVWLLDLDGETVGALTLENEPEQLYIYSVAVSPRYQKQGYGRRLLLWAEEEARRLGYERIRLFTNALMAENIALYLRLGYVETGREPYLGSTLVHMEKQLTA